MSSRHSVMTLFSSSDDPHSHRTRLVIAEKGLSVDVVEMRPGEPSTELAQLNPYQEPPTLVDRDLVLYDSRVICEYLDERFPHPPLMPVDPMQRAQFRVALYRIERDLYGPAREIEREADKRHAQKWRKLLRDSLLASGDIFKAKAYFLGEQFSLVDAAIAPILWRLPWYGVELPAQPAAHAILKYANQLFARPTFRDSLSAAEREMRP